MGGAYKVSVGKLEVKEQVARTCKKMQSESSGDRKGDSGLDSLGSELGPVAGSPELGNKNFAFHQRHKVSCLTEQLLVSQHGF